MSQLVTALGPALMLAVVAACNPRASTLQATTQSTAQGGGGDSLSAVIDAARIDGKPNAPVWFVVASDFQCPYCKQFHDQSLDSIRQRYVATGKIRIAYINYPLPMHGNAVPAARAAMCAGAQAKFWQLHDALFTTQKAWAEKHPATAVIDSVAVAVGVDTAAMHACEGRPSVQALIDADQERAQQAGVKATPTVLVGRQLIEGAQPFSTYRAAIEAALAKPN